MTRTRRIVGTVSALLLAVMAVFGATMPAGAYEGDGYGANPVRTSVNAWGQLVVQVDTPSDAGRTTVEISTSNIPDSADVDWYAIKSNTGGWVRWAWSHNFLDEGNLYYIVVRDRETGQIVGTDTQYVPLR